MDVGDSKRACESLDAKTTIDQLRKIVSQFVAERDWQQFHSPKNLSMSIAIEAAELMEHFQWISIQESRAVSQDREKKEQVSDEMADVLCYLLALANELDVDLASALQAKMTKNQQKYPTEVFRGRYGKDDPG